MNLNLLSVDFQNDFCAEGGIAYKLRGCHKFVRKDLVEFLRKRSLKIAEIVSDYRMPVANHRQILCVPGEPGFESQIPQDVKFPQPWIKCRHNPTWVRENGGIADKVPSPGHPDPESFSRWIEKQFGPAESETEITLIGLVLDGCVMCTGQELSFRGYSVRYLFEGVDCYSGSVDEKKFHLERFKAYGWGEGVRWNEMI